MSIFINNKKILGTEPSVNSGDLGLFAESNDVWYVKKSDGTTYPLGSGGSGSVSIDLNQISFGTNTGLTSSPFFTIDSNDIYLIFGSNSISGTSSNSSIIGGENNIIATQSSFSSIIGGQNNIINCQSPKSSIIGGVNNFILDSTYANITGVDNTIVNSPVGGILSSYSSILSGSARSTIIGGENHSVDSSPLSSIISGQNNCIDGTERSSIINGDNNVVCYNSCNSVIIGGFNNTINSSTQSVILGGSNLTLNNQCDTALARNFWISGSMSPNNGVNFGVSATFSTGSSVVTICNGIIISVV